MECARINSDVHFVEVTTVLVSYGDCYVEHTHSIPFRGGSPPVKNAERELGAMV
jgi:hypothetical protein